VGHGRGHRPRRLARDAAAEAGPAFLLVGGLLAIGGVAQQDGVFEWLGGLAGSLPGHGLALLLGLLGMDCVVTAFLNLDTAVLFMTPVMAHAARRRGLGEAPFVYGSVLMANASSTLLPGANLTNLIVLSDTRSSGAEFARQMLWPTLAAIAVTAAVSDSCAGSSPRRWCSGRWPGRGAAPAR
jgi:arsenical pump membrane protein